MKTLSIQKILILALGLFMATSCSKDDTIQLPEKESPIKTFISDGLIPGIDCINCESHELGVFFTPQKDGLFEAFEIKLPMDGNYKVTLWNSLTKTPITEEIISVEAGFSKTQSITPIALNKNVQYVVSVNTNSWSKWLDNANPNVTEVFPKTIGSIKLEQYGYVAGSDQNFPTEFRKKYLSGMVSFIFQPTAE